MALRQHRGELSGHGAIMRVIHGGNGTPLSAIRLYRKGVTLRKALDMYGNLHLTIPYLLRGNKGT